MTTQEQAVIDNAKEAREAANETELHNRYLARTRIENILDQRKAIELDMLEYL